MTLAEIVVKNEEDGLREWCKHTRLKPNDAYIRHKIMKKHGKVFLVTRIIPYINYCPTTGVGLAHAIEEDITRFYENQDS